MEDIATMVKSVNLPVNVLAGMRGIQFNADELSRVGVKRISVGGALTRVALGAFLRAAREMQEHGTFSFVNEPISSGEISELLGREVEG